MVSFVCAKKHAAVLDVVYKRCVGLTRPNLPNRMT